MLKAHLEQVDQSVHTVTTRYTPLHAVTPSYTLLHTLTRWISQRHVSRTSGTNGRFI